jgi:polyferredoxin
MFGTMVFQTYLVFSGAETLRKAIKLFWTFKVPWKWAYNGSIFPDWVAQFGFGFYSLMLTSTLIGLIVMVLYKERTWCSFCPMGTISSWVAPKKAPLPKAFTSIHVSSACQMKCKQCARVCPMQLTPYDSRGEEAGYLHPDCLKCGKCTLACPTKIMTLKH